MDWEDDGRVAEQNLGALNMVCSGKLSHGPAAIFAELESDEYGLFDRAAFEAWVNGESASAIGFRKAYRSRTTALAAGPAAAAAAAAAAAVHCCSSGSCARGALSRWWRMRLASTST